ncbi:MAG: peptidoglycan-binding protein [Pseudomonadota bacterium]
MTPGTERAIRVYQRRIGLPEDGLPSEELLDKTYRTVNN